MCLCAAAEVKYDLVLSSGFLAFANHCGFLAAGAPHRLNRTAAPPQSPSPPHPLHPPLSAAVEDVGLPVGGIMGTSAGALIGSMYAAGYKPLEVRC